MLLSGRGAEWTSCVLSFYVCDNRAQTPLWQIVRNGGSLVPEYDASVVTHIVTDAQKRPTLQALGLKTLKDIPDHIPTVNWRWVISRLGKPPICGQGGVSMRPENLWMYAAFGERMDAGSSVSYSRVKGKPAELGDLSNISYVPLTFFLDRFDTICIAIGISRCLWRINRRTARHPPSVMPSIPRGRERVTLRPPQDHFCLSAPLFISLLHQRLLQSLQVASMTLSASSMPWLVQRVKPEYVLFLDITQVETD